MAERRITASDWLMLVLALVSVGLLAYEAWGDVTPEERRQIFLADYVIVGIFAVEFAVRWVKDERPKTFPLRYWYEALGMLPVHVPVVRGFRLFRVIRIVVILSRFGRAADRAFGEGYTRRFLNRFKAVIVETLGDAITVKVLDETLAVLQKGEYTRNLADALERHGDEMMGIIAQKVKQDPQVGAIRHVPGFDAMVTTSSRVTQRIIVDLLRDERMDQMVKDIIRSNVEQIRSEVRKREATMGVAATA